MGCEGSRPILVWVISIVLGAAASLNIMILSASRLDLMGSAYRSAVASLTSFDLVTLYVLFAVQLTSMVFFLRLRKRAVSWFGAYIGLASLAAFGYTLGAETPAFFNELVSLAGLMLALGILGYMLRLRKRHVLI
jgi:hypothetical protein